MTLEQERESAANEIYRLRNIVKSQESALLHWRRAYDELYARLNPPTVVTTGDNSCPKSPPS